jgi:hypothetical protein
MKFTEFKLSDITFGAYNGKGITLSLPNGDPLEFQIPRVRYPH